MATNTGSVEDIQMHKLDIIVDEGPQEAISMDEPDTQNSELTRGEKSKFIMAKIDQRQKDDIKASELHVAASRADVEAARALLNSGADPNITDEEDRTVLHCLCTGRQSSKEITAFFNLIKDKVTNFNGQDVWGNTPLHHVAKSGYLKVVELLLQEGAHIDPTDWCNATPLHLAASAGHTSVVRLLLDNGADPTLRDDEGDTPAHYAAVEAQTQVLKEIIQRFPDCAQLRGSDKKTILHWAALSGNLEIVKYVVTQVPQGINAKARSGLAPLHYTAHKGACVKDSEESAFHVAMIWGHLKIATFLLENGAKVFNEDFKLILEQGYKNIAKAVTESMYWASALRGHYENKKGRETTAFRELIVKMPDVAKMVLDRCTVENKSRKRDDKYYSVIYNYEFIEDFDDNYMLRNDDPDDTQSDTNGCSYEELNNRPEYLSVQSHSRFRKFNHPLEIMVKRKRLDLLTHPVVGSLLHYKWRKFGLTGYVINLLFFILFLTFLTAFALLVPKPQSSLCRNITMNVSSEEARKLCPDIDLRAFLIFSSAAVILMAFTQLLFEIIQLAAQRLSYFIDWVNWMEMILYVCSIIFVSVYGMDCFCVADWQWQVGVVAVFLGWINLVVFFSKFPFLGIYVIILIKISKTFLKMVMLSILLIVSFGLTFFMIFFDASVLRSPFVDVPRSLLKVMTMTTGEFEFDDIFRLDPSGGSDNEMELPFLPISSILWIVFIIFMPVVLINMMTGLAVGDIEAVLKEAQLQKLALQVDQTLSTEELVVTLQRLCGRCCPKSWGRFWPESWQKTKLYQKIYPNKKTGLLSLKGKLFSPLKLLFCQKLNEKEKKWVRGLSFLFWEGEHYDDIQVITQTLTASKSQKTKAVSESEVESTGASHTNKLVSTMADSVSALSERMSGIEDGLKFIMDKLETMSQQK